MGMILVVSATSTTVRKSALRPSPSMGEVRWG
jgi:hypothetical protein